MVRCDGEAMRSFVILLVAALMAGCSSASYGLHSTTSPSSDWPSGDAIPSQSSNGRPSVIPRASGPCAHLAGGQATALVQVLRPDGTVWANTTVHEGGYDLHGQSDGFVANAVTNTTGCASFAFVRPGSYGFGADGGCWSMGNVWADWNGTRHLEVTLPTMYQCT